MLRLPSRPGLIALAAAVVLPLAGPTGLLGQAVAAPSPSSGKIAGAYIVTVADGVDPSKLVRKYGAEADHLYRAALNGFAAALTDKQRDKLAADPDVVAIEQDGVVVADATQVNAPYGPDRIDQRALPLSGTYDYTATGAGVTAYVIDTGIATAHSQFGGRASNVFDSFGGNGQDCHGHGTHVAGTIGAATYGVAKAVDLRGMRVLDCSGSGATSGIIAAIDWVRANGVRPAVANMSLGGGFSSALNTATTNLANSGVFVAVAAGNDNQKACNVSPASATNVTVVAASDKTDTRASFSNHGSCVDLYAPGVAVTSTWLNGGVNTISGTSMASPHAAGVGVLYKAAFGDAASSTINGWITGNATSGVIKSNRQGTANLLLFTSGL